MDRSGPSPAETAFLFNHMPAPVDWHAPCDTAAAARIIAAGAPGPRTRAKERRRPGSIQRTGE